MSADPNFDNYLKTFVGLSSILTGYLPNQLAPTIDPIRLAAEYLNTMLLKAESQIFLQTLSVYENINSQFPLSPDGKVQDPNSPNDKTKIPDPNRDTQTELVDQQIFSDPDMGAIARRMIRLWYLGTWYTNEPPDGAGEVVSMNAYTKGLAWDAFFAHPMGFSEEIFGYWASPPPSAAPKPPEVSSEWATSQPGAMSGGRQRGGV